MTGKGGIGQACAACKYQRRKCSPDCPLAPYFPPDQPRQFLNAHKLFGVSNILRILKQLPDDRQKSDAMKSMVYQANAREKDPVHGCFGIIVMLQTQVERLKEELELVRSQVMLLDQQFENKVDPYNSNLPAQQHQQQHLQPLGNGAGVMPNSWIYPSYVHSPYVGYDGQGIYRHSNLRPSNNLLLEYEPRQDYSDSKDAYESSAESSLKESQCLLEPVADHEQLKSAAALFTLTNGQH
eukprot:PITA_11400